MDIETASYGQTGSVPSQNETKQALQEMMMAFESFKEANDERLDALEKDQSEDGLGGYKLSWIRRSRIGGDNFEAPEISLGETSERYRINLIGKSKSLDAWETSSPVFHVTTDKLAPHADAESLQIQVSQIGSSGLRGYISQITLR